MIVVGIAGGTASGKTTFAKALAARVGEEHTLLLPLDAYYHDPSHLPFEERTRINYDHPDAYDFALLLSHLEALGRNEPVPRLSYDYTEHARVVSEETLTPKRLVVLEGILVLCEPALRERLDLKLYIDTAVDVCLLRRLGRDIRERGRSIESVAAQYLEFVRPMHLEFTEPSKRHADLIIPEGAENRIALDMIAARVTELLEKS